MNIKLPLPPNVPLYTTAKNGALFPNTSAIVAYQVLIQRALDANPLPAGVVRIIVTGYAGNFLYLCMVLFQVLGSILPDTELVIETRPGKCGSVEIEVTETAMEVNGMIVKHRR